MEPNIIENCTTFLKSVFKNADRNENSKYSPPNISLVLVSDFTKLDMIGITIHDENKVIQFCKYVETKQKDGNFLCSAFTISKRYISYYHISSGKIYNSLFQMVSENEEFFSDKFKYYNETMKELKFSEVETEKIQEGSIVMQYRGKRINQEEFFEIFPEYKDFEDFETLFNQNKRFFKQTFKFFKILHKKTSKIREDTLIWYNGMMLEDIHQLMISDANFAAEFAYYIERENYSYIHTFRPYKEIQEESIENISEILKISSDLEEISESANEIFSITDRLARKTNGQQELFSSIAISIIKNVFKLIFN